MKNLIALFKIKEAQAVFLLFGIFFGWWLWLMPYSTDMQRQVWSALYQVLAWFGCAVGIAAFRSLGGFKSPLAKAILGFSLGLLFQSFGQTGYSYYILFRHIAVPYPSWADAGFFGSIPFYCYGILQLAKVSVVGGLSLKSLSHKIQAFLIPSGILALSYYVFLKGYIFDWSDPAKIFLDFGYPLGEAVYISIAILTFVQSRKILGGVMKGPATFLIMALMFQYISDYTFLYQANRGLWRTAGTGDFMYTISYLLMSLGIIYTSEVSKRVREMNVYGDRMVFTSPADDFALVVENKELAEALRKGFLTSFFHWLRRAKHRALNPIFAS